MNELTERLLAQGYNPDDPPDYVRWYANMKEFEYTSKFLASSTWEAPCGVMRKGEFTHGYGWINGICWRVENNNYNYACPYEKEECEFFHPLLKDTGVASKCSWCLTEKPYNYDNSAEKIEDDRRKLTLQNLERRFGYPGMIHCICCHIDKKTCEPYFKYNPEQCIRFTRNGCVNKTCYCTGKERNVKTANIYYDVKVTTERRIGFIIEPIITVFKGIKLFETPKSITDLEMYLKLNPDAPLLKETRSRQHSEALFFAEHLAEYSDKYRKYKLEIQNVRIEKKESRDLIQDLEDIREGITVVHKSDSARKSKELKSQKRAKTNERKIAKLEANILKIGYENLEPLEKRHADKWLTKGRLMELKYIRKQKMKEEQEKPMQLSLFDIY
ncbi:hypothetical protein [Lacrimispora sp.]|uniref:hypothetical protein n=1 Tax=Lacrimispora sp. TaxID=2719234 RepID=UPI0034614484